MVRFVSICILCLLAVPVYAADSKDVPEAFHNTNLPLPRFASLSADEVYVRSGPGLKYPIKWVYKKPNLPVEIILEYEVWRKIRDVEGQVGWVHLSLLSGKRSGVIIRPPEPKTMEIPPTPEKQISEDLKERVDKINTIAKPAEGTPPAPPPIPVYQKPRQNARWAAQIEPGAIVGLDECVSGWCLVSASGYRGWIERKYLWGLYPSETFK